MNNFFASQHIYKIITVRYPDLKENEKKLKIQIILKQLINIIRELSHTTELDRFHTPMAFLFQHIKKDIVELVANCVPLVERIYLQRQLVYNLDWNIRLFKSLVNLNAKDIIIWYFFQIPYYIEDANTKYKIRNLYNQLLDYFLDHWQSDFTISENEFLFISNETCMPYASAYHNENNVSILTKYSRLIRKICPWVNYYSPRVAEQIIKKVRKNNTLKHKICFISDSFATDSSVLRDRIGIIGKLDNELFDVYIASFLPEKAYHGILASKFINKFKKKFIHLPASLTNARMLLEKYEFDIIIYPDLGMKLLPTLLAYSRIAPIQMTTWGHSETSGIDTIDYYVSSQYFESGDIESGDITKRYSEKLVLFKSLGTYYFSPNLIFIENNIKLGDNYHFKKLDELGFPNDCHIYCCLQTFYKMNEEFERCLGRILELDTKGIILLSNSMPYCKSHLLRLKNAVGNENIKRLRWYPSIEKPVYLNLVAVADVVLDPFPFGGCNTTFEAFDYNVPVITWPSDFLHGRFTLGLYKKMDMSDCECIVNSAEEYAQISTGVAINEKLKHKLNRAIEAGKSKIFQERESVDEWNQWLYDILYTLEDLK